MCGEAPALSGGFSDFTGPSPRVRGSRRHAEEAAAARGSIPACAGKPHRGVLLQGQIRVHPRVCGEAAPDNPQTER